MTRNFSNRGPRWLWVIPMIALAISFLLAEWIWYRQGLPILAHRQEQSHRLLLADWAMCVSGFATLAGYLAYHRFSWPVRIAFLVPAGLVMASLAIYAGLTLG